MPKPRRKSRLALETPFLGGEVELDESYFHHVRINHTQDLAI
jgi:hypothetical protein